MKNKILLVFLVLFLAAAAVIAGFYFLPPKVTSIEDVLPEGPLIYLSQKDLAKLTTDFTNSSFGKQMATINLPQLLEQSGVVKQDIQIMEAVFKQSGEVIKSPIFQKLFGQELGIAVYPVQFVNYDMKAILDMLTNLVVVIRLDKEAEFLEFLSHFFKQVNQQFVSEQVQYKNHLVMHVTVPQLAKFGFKLSYTKIGPYLVISFGEENVHQSIDAWKRQKNSLAKDRNYQLTKARFLEKPQTVAYVNLETFSSKLRSELIKMTAAYEKKSPAGGPSEMEQILSGLEGFLGFGYSALYGETIQSKMNFAFVKEKMTSVTQQFYSCQPIPNKNIQFVPSDALAYQWSNCYDLAAYWSQFKAEVSKIPSNTNNPQEGQGPSPQEIIAGVEKMLKLSIDKDILPVLGKEQGWVLSDIESSGAFPIPKFLFFISINDRTKAEQMMKTVLDQPVLFVQNEEYKGVAINYISTPLSVDIQPAYCFLDNYLLLASSRQLFHTAIDTHQNPVVSLRSDPYFKQLNFDVNHATNGNFFLRVDAFAKNLQKVIEWGSAWVVAKAKEMDAYKSGSQKRLADLETEMKTTEAEIQAVKEEIKNFKKERQGIVAQGGDTQAVDSSINADQEKLSLKQKSVNSNKEKRQELEGIIDSLSKEKSLDPELLKLYLDNLVYPGLKAFEFIHAIGSEMRIGENYLDTTTIIK